jgi:hypothetical protein
MSVSAALQSKYPQYYYTVTGDVVQGDNKSAKEFTVYAESRFPINRRGEIVDQAAGWGKQVTGEISPLYSNVAPGMIPAPFSEGRSTPLAFNA